MGATRPASVCFSAASSRVKMAKFNPLLLSVGKRWHFAYEAFIGCTKKRGCVVLTHPLFCRKEATRTPDPYVPNVVRYQLRYFPILVVQR